MSIIGFTGTQDGMAQAQRVMLIALLTRLKRLSVSPNRFMHGDCVGADTEAAEAAKGLGYATEAFPGPDPYRRGGFVSDRENMPMPFMDRNRVIAMRCEVLVATPKQEQEVLRSGTWATVRYARENDKSIYLVQPSGRLDAEWQLGHDRVLRTGIAMNAVRW